jgi:acetyl-CoA carboxylase biotin carboxyl carrier protein
MDIRKIRRLIEMLEGSDISEIEVSEGEETVKIRRGSMEPVVQQVQAAPQAAPAPQMPAAQGQPAPAAPAPEPEPETGITVEAPMVGTFYRAPTPEAEPYVREGDRVNVGDTLCIIEAMKLFNEIESEHAGTVKKIMAENAQPVEYGEPLFIIEPDA